MEITPIGYRAVIWKLDKVPLGGETIKLKFTSDVTTDKKHRYPKGECPLRPKWSINIEGFFEFVVLDEYVVKYKDASNSDRIDEMIILSYDRFIRTYRDMIKHLKIPNIPSQIPPADLNRIRSKVVEFLIAGLQ
jgi:hypothetical protein